MIGELLLERKIITKEELTKALEAQKREGGYVSQHLIAMGAATEFDIANCLSSQYGFPYLPLKNYNVPPEALEIFPLKFIKIYSIFPIDKTGSVLSIAMADPLNDGVVEMLRHISNCEIEVFISTYSDIKRQINYYFSNRLKEKKKEAFSEEDLIKENIVQPFIQTIGYSGKERRRSLRVETELEMGYFLEGKAFKGRIKNISYAGVYFITDSFLPIDMNVYSKINLKSKAIEPIIQVVRVERLKEAQRVDDYEVNLWNHGIAVFFSFITDEDKDTLALFLKEALTANNKIKQD